MLKKMVRWSVGRLGYDVVGRHGLARTRDDLAEVQSELARTRAKMDAYRAAYEQAKAGTAPPPPAAASTPDLDEVRSQLAGYKGAYQAVCSQLSAANVILKQLQPDGDLAVESMRSDPPIVRRLKDTPGLLEELRADFATSGLPAEAGRVLLDPDFSLEDRVKYYQLLQACTALYWDRAGALVSKIINAQYLTYKPRSGDPVRAKRYADELRREGLVRLDPLLTPTQLKEAQTFIHRCGMFNGHTPNSARHRVLRRYVNYTAQDFPLGSYSIGELAMAPHILELALHPVILDAAAEYFGCAPKLTWLQSWWNFKGGQTYSHGQNNYHRDSNDFRMFWVYVYLTDVGPDSGPHKLIRRSADFDLVRERFAAYTADPARAAKLGKWTLDDFLHGLGHPIPDVLKEEMMGDLAEVLTGPAGTIFFTRGVDFHKVLTPVMKKRQILAIRYCMNDFADLGPDRDGDPVPGEIVADRVGDDEQMRHITSMRFDWDKKVTD